MDDGGVVVCARAISDSSRHGGQRNGGGEDAEMRVVVGGPGSERKWMHGREGHATNTRGPGGRHDDDGASLSLAVEKTAVHVQSSWSPA